MRAQAGIALVLLAGCAAMQPAPEASTVQASPADCRPELGKVNAQLAAEVAERQRVVRAAARREETLRKQLDALKAIERGILEREERKQTKAR